MSLLRKGILAGGGSVVCAGLGVLTSMMLSRALLPEGMGRYQLPLTTATLVITILGLGVGQSNIYFLNKHKIEPRQIVMNSIWFGLTGIVGLVILLPIIFTLFESYFGILPIWVKIFYSLGVSASFCFNLLRPILMAALQVRQSVQSQIINRATFLLIVFFCFVLNFSSVDFTLAALAISHITALAIVVYFLKDRIDFSVSFAWAVFGRVLKYGLHLLASNLVYVLNASIGLMLLRYLMPENFATIGFYGRAVALCGLITLIPYAAGPLLYSKWSNLSGDARRGQVEFAMRLHLALGFIIVSALALFGSWCVIILYSREFLPAVSPLRILAVGVGSRCVFSVCNNLLASDGRAHITACVMGSSVITIAVLTWILVPHYGINGAALADMIGGILVLATGLLILKRSEGIQMRHIIFLKRSDLKCLRNALFYKSSI